MFSSKLSKDGPENSKRIVGLGRAVASDTEPPNLLLQWYKVGEKTMARPDPAPTWNMKPGVQCSALQPAMRGEFICTRPVYFI